MRHRKPHNDDAPLVDGDDKMKKNSKYTLSPACREALGLVQSVIIAFLISGIIIALSSNPDHFFPTSLEEIARFLIVEFLLCAVTLFFLIRMVGSILLDTTHSYEFNLLKLKKFIFKLLLFFCFMAIFMSLITFSAFTLTVYVIVICLVIYIYVKKFCKKEAPKILYEAKNSQSVLNSGLPEVSERRKILGIVFLVTLFFLSVLFFLSGHSLDNTLNIPLLLLLAGVNLLIVAVLGRSTSPKIEKIVDLTFAIGIIWMSVVIIYIALSLIGVIRV